VHVRCLELSAFRNYASLRFAPDSGLSVLIGENGQGKTSLLEALHLLITGRSFRTARLLDCVAWEAREAVVGGEIEDGAQRRAVRVTLAATDGVAMSWGTGGPCRWARAIAFSAADLALLTGVPALRRAYLDGAAAKLVPAHAEVCRRYRVVLNQRNRLLGHLAGRADAERLLAPWDEQVATIGSEIVHRRIETLAVLSQDSTVVWRAVARDDAEMTLAYAPASEPGAGREETRGRLLEALAAGRRSEMQRGMTLAGPHRDGLVVKLGRVDARTYASRGEQRLLVLSLRLAEAASVRRRVGTVPVMLLDDLLSELDAGARERVLGWLSGQGQVIFSTTDAVAAARATAVAWEVRHGEVEALETVIVGGAA
jgi:DNA replication and repair protein RecF